MGRAADPVIAPDAGAGPGCWWVEPEATRRDAAGVGDPDGLRIPRFPPGSRVVLEAADRGRDRAHRKERRLGAPVLAAYGTGGEQPRREQMLSIPALPGDGPVTRPKRPAKPKIVRRWYEEGDPPCVTQRCPHVERCRTERLACSAFNAYVFRGTAAPVPRDRLGLHRPAAPRGSGGPCDQ